MFRFFLVLLLILTLSCQEKLTECIGCSNKYPYYNESHLQSNALSIRDLSCSDATLDQVKTLKKIIVFPVTSRRNTVVGFADEFLSELEQRGWQVLDSDKEGIDVEIKKSHADVIAFYMTDMSHQRPRARWDFSHNQSAIKLYISEDMHSDTSRDSNKFFSEHADAVLVRYPEAFAQLIQHSKAPVYVFPHFAGREYFRAFQDNLHKASAVFLSGSLYSKWYPLRVAALQLLEAGNSSIILHKLASYDDQINALEQRKAYAAKISNVKIAITGAGMGPTILAPYILAKHFEIPATGTVMVTDKFVAPLMEGLGFIEGVHYLTSTPANLESDMANWLAPKNQEKLKAISEAGHKLVLERHTLEKRVLEFEKVIAHVFRKKRGALP